jgi:hypothetical protein
VNARSQKAAKAAKQMCLNCECVRTGTKSTPNVCRVCGEELIPVVELASYLKQTTKGGR